jgi:hypothetical protein
MNQRAHLNRYVVQRISVPLILRPLVPDRDENVTLSGVVGACQMFDKPCRIVPGITGP